MLLNAVPQKHSPFSIFLDHFAGLQDGKHLGRAHFAVDFPVCKAPRPSTST